MKAPVLLIFFNRVDTLEETFAQIRKARPEKLYLAQDGPRPGNEEDRKGIAACRAVVEAVDWPCEVHKNYAAENRGCGRGPKAAIDWLFESETCGIVVEDDCVADESFFDFCDELLERYAEDERVFLISGCNLELKSNVDTSYFFGYAGTNWGWATWKRCWERMDYACSWVNDPEKMERLRSALASQSGRKAAAELAWFQQTWQRVSAGEEISYWDVQFQAVRYLYHQLSVIPAVNLITNIGAGAQSTHARSETKRTVLNSKVGKVNALFNSRYSMAFPLRHPAEVVRNSEYDDKVDRYLYPPFVSRMRRKVFHRIRQLFSRC